MKNGNHLTDAEIQRYALGEGAPDGGVTKHIEGCTHCAARAELYRGITASIAVAPKPAFDFELAPAVLAMLPAQKPKYSSTRAIMMCIAISGVLFCILSFYYLNSGLLHGVFLSSMSTAYGIVVSCALLLAFLAADLWRVHIRKIQKLNAPETLQQNLRGAV